MLCRLAYAITPSSLANVKRSCSGSVAAHLASSSGTMTLQSCATRAA